MTVTRRLDVSGWILLALGGFAVPSRPTWGPGPERTTTSDSIGSFRWEFATKGGLPLSLARDAAGRPFLFVAQKDGGLLVLRLAASGPPTIAGRIDRRRFGGLHVTTLTQQGNYLYLGLGDFFATRGSRSGLAAVDVSDPAAPVVVGTWISPGTMSGATHILAVGPTVYLAAKAHGVLLFDVANPAAISLVAEILPDVNFPKPGPSRTERPNARGLFLVGERLFVANDAGGLRVLDVSDRTAPREIGRYVNPALRNKPRAYNHVVVRGATAYVAVDYCGLEILDVADPTAIRQIGWWNPWACETGANTWFNSPGQTNQLILDDEGRLAHLSAGGSELVVVDVSNPASPRLVNQYRTPGGKQGVWGVALGPTETYLGYIRSVVPFRGTWAGIRSVTTHR